VQPVALYTVEGVPRVIAKTPEIRLAGANRLLSMALVMPRAE
jgi:hypothetical protein